MEANAKAIFHGICLIIGSKFERKKLYTLTKARQCIDQILNNYLKIWNTMYKTKTKTYIDVGLYIAVHNKHHYM